MYNPHYMYGISSSELEVAERNKHIHKGTLFLHLDHMFPEWKGKTVRRQHALYYTVQLNVPVTYKACK